MDRFKLFGKENVLAHLNALSAAKRIPHGLLFSGDKGLGKRVLAKYIAMQWLCSDLNSEGEPCGKCNACNKILQDEHPDVVFPKGEKYTKENLHNLVRDSVIKPNDGVIRIYIFENCDEMTAEQQNLLLKLIEEPSDFNRFVFTSENTSKILPTILSRIVPVQINTPDKNSCIECLEYLGIETEQAEILADDFSGNIGKCLDAHKDETQMQLIESAKSLVKAIADKNEYALAVSFNKISDRNKLGSVLVLVSEIVRDGVMLCAGCDEDKLNSCDKNGAKKLSETLTLRKLTMLMDKLLGYISQSNVNVNVSLTTAKYSCEIFSVL